MHSEREAKTVCPSGLRGWTQVPLAQAAWVQIPQLSFTSKLLQFQQSWQSWKTFRLTEPQTEQLSTCLHFIPESKTLCPSG